MSELTTTERQRLTELEAVVDRGLRTFLEVGRALKEIRDARLYRQTHATFEEYCRERFDFSRQRGNQLISAAEVTTMVVNAGLPAPENERQTRELVPLLRDGEDAVVAARRAQEAESKRKEAQRAKRKATIKAIRARVVPARPLDRVRKQLREEIKQGRKHSIAEDTLRWFHRSGKPRLTIVPLELHEANAVIEALHRHHGTDQGHRFCIGVEDEHGNLLGAAIVGRPRSRHTNQKEVLEITKVGTNGTPNAPSALYSAAARVGKELGYKQIQTFILESESGDSLRAAGFTFSHDSPGGSWSSPSRPRVDKHPTGPKKCFVRQLRT